MYHLELEEQQRLTYPTYMASILHVREQANY